MDGSVSGALVGARFQEPDFSVSLAGFRRDSGWRYFKFVNVPHESPLQPVHCPQTAQTQLCRRAGVQPLCRAHPLASRPVPGRDLGKGPVLLRPSCSPLPSVLVSLFPAGPVLPPHLLCPSPRLEARRVGPSTGLHSQVTSDPGPPALSLPVLRVLWDSWPPWAHHGASPARNASVRPQTVWGSEARSHGDPLPSTHRSQGRASPLAGSRSTFFAAEPELQVTSEGPQGFQDKPPRCPPLLPAPAPGAALSASVFMPWLTFLSVRFRELPAPASAPWACFLPPPGQPIAKPAPALGQRAAVVSPGLSSPPYSQLIILIQLTQRRLSAEHTETRIEGLSQDGKELRLKLAKQRAETGT